MTNKAPRTLFEKLWSAHAITVRDNGDTLLWVDRHYVHDSSFHAFNKLRERGATVRRPDLTFAMPDHYVPTNPNSFGLSDHGVAGIVDQLRDNARSHSIKLFDLGDRRRGIVHVVGPEQGLTLPGLFVTCGDSHTSTHGALGAFAFGVGASEVAHVLMTQTLWQRKLATMRISVTGTLAPGVGAKDLALAIIGRIGTGGAAGHAVEYCGRPISDLSIESRLTLCNLAIESGARCGLVAADEKTLRYVEGRAFAPKGDAFKRALDDWADLYSDASAAFDRDVSFDASDIAPVVTWGTSPEDVLPITGETPDPAAIADASKSAHAQSALDYMGLRPRQRLSDVAIDQVFIGSCTNGRIEDLRMAASVLAGRHAVVPGLVSPGSGQVKQQAEEEGLDQIFIAAGLVWGDAGCSMCVGMNGDLVRPEMRCASTTNRNFIGRQGPKARTHLMSPAMAAAAAITGRLTDVRPMLEGRS